MSDAAIAVGRPPARPRADRIDAPEIMCDIRTSTHHPGAGHGRYGATTPAEGIGMEFGIFLNGYLPGPASRDTECEHTMIFREMAYVEQADKFNWKYAWFGEHH